MLILLRKRLSFILQAPQHIAAGLIPIILEPPLSKATCNLQGETVTALSQNSADRIDSHSFPP